MALARSSKLVALSCFAVFLLTGCGGGGNQQTVITGGGTLLIQTGPTTIKKLNRSTGALTDFPIPQVAEGPVFNSDFSQYVAPSADARSFALYNIDGTKVRDLSTPGTNQFLEWSVSANFEYIVAGGFAPPGSPIFGIRIPINGGAHTVLSNTRPDSINSPGTRFSYPNGSANGIWISNLDGTNAVRVTTREGDERSIISPDGSKIVYRRNNLPSAISSGLAVANVDGTSDRLIISNQHIPLFRWSNDGSEVMAYISSEDVFDFSTSSGYWVAINVNTGATRTYLDLRPLNSVFSCPVAP